jgi:hypothetical protein
MINAKLQNLYNIKNDIGTAIVNKGGTITESTPFYSYAGEIDNISTGPSSYSGWVVEDLNGAKYTAITNISTGTISNLISENQANMAFINNTANYGGTVIAVTINNGFIYAGGPTNQTVQKFYESNLVRTGNTASYGGTITTLTTNNGFIYAGGVTNRTVQKFHESNLTFVNNTPNFGGDIFQVAINNGFIYVGGATDDVYSNGNVKKYNESTLAFVGGTVNYGSFILSVVTNNGFIYAAGSGTNRVQKFYESNLAFVGNTVSYGGNVEKITINNGFIYVGGSTNQTVQKFNESTLAFVGNTADYGGPILSVFTNNGFIYAGGQTNFTVKKFYESNLAFVGNTASYGDRIRVATTNNGFIYAGGEVGTVHKFQEAEIEFGNPAILNTYAFNRWLLNNSAGTPLLANTVMVANAIIQGPNYFLNEANMAFINKTTSHDPILATKFLEIDKVKGQIIVGNFYAWYFNANNLSYLGNSSIVGTSNIQVEYMTSSPADNNESIYFWSVYNAAHSGPNLFRTNGTINSSITVTYNPGTGNKFAGGNTVFIDQTVPSTENNCVYISTYNIAGSVGPTIRRISKTLAANITAPAPYSGVGGGVYAFNASNAFLYAGGSTPPSPWYSPLFKYSKTDLSLIAQTPNYGAYVNTIGVNNGFVYATGSGNNSIRKFYESNLVLVGNTPLHTYSIADFKIHNGYIYATDYNLIKKYNETTLGYVGQTEVYRQYEQITRIAIYNNNLYMSGNFTTSFQNVVQYQTKQENLDNLTTYSITSLKEE